MKLRSILFCLAFLKTKPLKQKTTYKRNICICKHIFVAENALKTTALFSFLFPCFHATYYTVPLTVH